MKILKSILSLSSCLLLAGTAFSSNLTIDYSVSSSPWSLGGQGAGQTFFPADVAGYAGQGTLNLTELSFWTGNLGGAGHATTYIAIYDGDPDTSTLVGMSTNFVDTSSGAGIPNYTELTWTFASLSLNANTEYWAVMSNASTDVNPTNTVGRSLQEFDHMDAPNDAYRGLSIIANRAPHSSSIDLRFRATFAKNTNVGNEYCAEAAYTCPCFLVSAVGEGCPNTTGVGGTIAGSGDATIGSSTFSLTAGQLPDTVGLFVQGTSAVGGADGNPVGEGRLCLGPQKRYAPQSISGGTVTRSNFDSFASATQTMNYQFWYRDPGNTCNGGGFNFTPAWTVTWN